jgi:hypothetical protein
MMTMKQIIFGSVLSLLLFGFFVEQVFAQETGTNGGIAAGGTKGASITATQIEVLFL